MFKNECRKSLFNGAPMAILMLAAVLEEQGHKCAIYDANAKGSSCDECLQYVKDFTPDMVGFYVLTPYVDDVYLLSNKIKEYNSEINIIVGGPHAIHRPQEILENEHIDFACTGEGEHLIVELTRALENGDTQFDSINGLAFRRDGNIVETNKRDYIKDLDSLPFPAYHLVDFADYVSSRNWTSGDGNFASINTGRGCPHNCVFCEIPAISGRKYRHMSAPKVVQMFNTLSKKYAVNKIKITDGTFTVDKQYLVSIAQGLIENNNTVDWTINGSVKTLPEYETLVLLKKACLESIFFGIESGSATILKAIKKVTQDDVIDAITRTKNAGIAVHCSFIFGLPGETMQTIEETISFAKKLNPDTVSFTIAIPFPGTEMTRQYEEQGAILHKEWSRYIDEPVISLDGGLTPDYLNKMVIRAHRRFYLRPTYLLKRVLVLKSLKQFTVSIKMLKGLLIGKLRHKL